MRPPVGVAWARQWSPNGEDSGAASDARVAFDGAELWFKSVRGEPGVLVVHPGDQWVSLPAGVLGAVDRRRARCREVAIRFADAHAARLDMPATRQVAPVEYAVELDGLQPFGTPGASLVWCDGSPGGGRFEVETQEARVARSLLEWAQGGAAEALDIVVERSLKA